MKSWTVTQQLSLITGVLFLAHSIGGMVVNPDFAVGDDATSEVWLWMDWNGWHALAGIALWATAIAVSPRADLSRIFAVAVIATQLPLVGWMLVDSRPLGLLVMPSTADLVFHSVTVLLFVAALVIDRDRKAVTAR